MKRMAHALRAKGKLRRAIEGAAEPRLHLGAGRTILPGWVNTDLDPTGREVVFLDVTKPIALPEGSVRLVHSEHVIEHIDRESAKRMIAECFRILMPGGRIRVTTPSLDRLVAIVQASPPAEAMRYVSDAQRWYARFFADDSKATACQILNLAFYEWGHRHLYTFEELRGLLANVGFESIAEFPAGKSNTLGLADLEARAHEVGAVDLNVYEALCVEAAKPGKRV